MDLIHALGDLLLASVVAKYAWREALRMAADTRRYRAWARGVALPPLLRLDDDAVPFKFRPWDTPAPRRTSERS